MFVTALSPYDLHARAEAAHVALLLADHVVTIRPAPLEGDSREQVQEAALDAPAFEALLRAWRWTGPLWRAGVLLPTWLDAVPIDDVQQAASEIEQDGGALASVIGASRFDATGDFLEAMCQDLIRGGRDPAIAVPLAAGLERFAARHGLTLVRGPDRSLSAKLGGRSATPLARVTTVVPLGLDAEELLALREAARPALAALRRGLLVPPDERLSQAGDALANVIETFGTEGERLVQVRLTVSALAAGSVEAGAAAALGKAPAAARGSTSELAHRGAALLTVKPLPWGP